MNQRNNTVKYTYLHDCYPNKYEEAKEDQHDIHNQPQSYNQMLGQYIECSHVLWNSLCSKLNSTDWESDYWRHSKLFSSEISFRSHVLTKNGKTREKTNVLKSIQKILHLSTELLPYLKTIKISNTSCIIHITKIKPFLLFQYIFILFFVSYYLFLFVWKHKYSSWNNQLPIYGCIWDWISSHKLIWLFVSHYRERLNIKYWSLLLTCYKMNVYNHFKYLHLIFFPCD